jgi:hypothetical protein
MSSIKSFTKFAKKGLHLPAKPEAEFSRIVILASTPTISSGIDDSLRLSEHSFLQCAADAPSSTPPSSGEGVGDRSQRPTSFRHETYPRGPIIPSERRSEGSFALSTSDPEEITVKVSPILQQGTPMLKVSAKKIKTKLVRFDSRLGRILWDSKSTKFGALFSEVIRRGHLKTVHFTFQLPLMT